MTKYKRFNDPPVIQNYRIDTAMPLHRLAAKRIANSRDLKILITAENSETGVGKTTLAGWLGLSWTHMFAGHDWFVKPDDRLNGMGTLDPIEYFDILAKVGVDKRWNPGTVVVVDDAEELDARRSMQNLNVEFTQRWMLMRLKQAITIITLPSPAAVDSRVVELADVWINITRRGKGVVHDIRVNSYGNRNVMTERKHDIEFPDISDHDQLVKLREMKQDKMDRWDETEEQPDPEEVKRSQKVKIAQRMRNAGSTIQEIADALDMSIGWVSQNTENPSEKNQETAAA
jgi:hypothetical protein